MIAEWFLFNTEKSSLSELVNITLYRTPIPVEKASYLGNRSSFLFYRFEEIHSGCRNQFKKL